MPWLIVLKAARQADCGPADYPARSTSTTESPKKKESAWLAVPELYDLSRDPTETYDIAQLHPEIVGELSKELEELLPTFPDRVIAANDELKKKKGDISTPPGVSPKPVGTRG